jgi:plasmid stability protein
MSNLLIHDFGKDLRVRLQRDADGHGRSVDEHVRVLLAQALGFDPEVSDLEHKRVPGIEHIELVDDGRSHEKSLREHTRVEYGDIKARFSFDASTKMLGLFTRYFACDVLDISVRGARIRSHKQLREHEAILLHFIPVGGEKITIAGLVIRAALRGANQFEYGVKFSEVMPQGDLRALICRKVVEQKFCD